MPRKAAAAEKSPARSGPARSSPARSSPARSYGGLAAEERREQRRQRFIEAGIQVFGTRGLPNSTMRDLCAEARLTDRYFYESFRRVEDVFDLVYAELSSCLIVRLGTAMMGAPLQMDAVAEAGLRAFFGFVQEDRRRARILLVDSMGVFFSAPQGSELPIGEYVDLLRQLYRALYPQAEGLDIDVDFVVKSLLGMTINSAALWAHDGFDKSLDEVVRHNLFAWRGLDGWIRELIDQRASAQVAQAKKPRPAARRPRVA